MSALVTLSCQPVEIAVEVSVGDGALMCGIEADCEGSAEPDRGEGDVGRGDVVVDRVVASGDVDQLVEHVLRTGSSIGPFRGVEQRVDDIDHSEAVIDGGVHIAAQRFAAGG